MNVYRVISERFTVYDRIEQGIEVPEPYAVVAIVRARNTSQARYLACKADPETRNEPPLEWPNCSVRLVDKNVEGGPEVLPEPAGWMWYTLAERKAGLHLEEEATA